MRNIYFHNSKSLPKNWYFKNIRQNYCLYYHSVFLGHLCQIDCSLSLFFKVCVRRWKSLLHHICGVHRWEDNGVEYKCEHQRLTGGEQRRKKWLKADSSGFHTLKAIVMDPNILRDLKQMSHFKHTGMLLFFSRQRRNVILKFSLSRPYHIQFNLVFLHVFFYE